MAPMELILLFLWLDYPMELIPFVPPIHGWLDYPKDRTP